MVRRALVAAALVLLIGCGNGTDDPGVSLEPTTAPTASSDASSIVAFRLADATVGCIGYQGDVRCDALEITYAPSEKPSDCDLDWGHAVVVEEGGGRGHFVCAGDTAFDPGAEVLASGEAKTVGSITCTASSESISCVDEKTTHGFELSQAEYELF